MKHIKNPNAIVDQFVRDCLATYDKDLVSVIMYGSAVTHEYKPGSSDINIAIVLSDTSIPTTAKMLPLYKKWKNYGIAIPFLFTKEYIASSCDSYPIEFLDMRSNFRILFGEDVLSGIEIHNDHLRLQCEHDLKGISLHLRRAFIREGSNDVALQQILGNSIRGIIPLLRAVLIINGRIAPNAKSQIVSSVEDLFNLGASALSEVFNLTAGQRTHKKINWLDLYSRYTTVVDQIISSIDSHNHFKEESMQ